MTELSNKAKEIEKRYRELERENQELRAALESEKRRAKERDDRFYWAVEAAGGTISIPQKRFVAGAKRVVLYSAFDHETNAIKYKVDIEEYE